MPREWKKGLLEPGNPLWLLADPPPPPAYFRKFSGFCQSFSLSFKGTTTTVDRGNHQFPRRKNIEYCSKVPLFQFLLHVLMQKLTTPSRRFGILSLNNGRIPPLSTRVQSWNGRVESEKEEGNFGLSSRREEEMEKKGNHLGHRV